MADISINDLTHETPNENAQFVFNFGGVDRKVTRQALVDSIAQENLIDADPNALMRVGGFGIGAEAVSFTLNLDTLKACGFYRTVGGTVGLPSGVNPQGTILVSPSDPLTESRTQIYYPPDEDRVFFRRQVGVSTWAPWQEHYHTGNILGIVSQVGGVPTGAVIESYEVGIWKVTKFASGKMIMEGKDTTTVAINISDGTFARGPSRTPLFTFPEPFASPPSTMPYTYDPTGSLSWASADSTVTTTTFGITLLSISTVASAKGGVILIGDWV